MNSKPAGPLLKRSAPQAQRSLRPTGRSASWMPWTVSREHCALISLFFNSFVDVCVGPWLIYLPLTIKNQDLTPF